MVTIEINGQQLEVKPGSMIIEAADDAGILIPRFCYHKKLSVAANCRMCLVEVEKAPKPLPACATPVADGMKIQTDSKVARQAQQSVMEFLLINHPLDCPICDQGGECELQDVAMGYGGDVSRFTEGKRVVKDKNIGPLIQTDMTRCIHCTRCVRFGQEIAGIRELGATGRGEHTEIGTFLEKSVDSEMSGNVIDLCPVGALTSKPYRFTARAWELSQHASISPHDCVGTNLYLHTKANQIKRVVPRENESINEVWIADRDRYGYLGVHSEERATEPMVKQSGEWKSVDWATAFDHVVDKLNKVLQQFGPEQLGALMSASSTTEEAYLLQKLVRSLGCDNIDYRLRQLDMADQEKLPHYPHMGQDIATLESLGSILLVGSNLRKDQPIIAHRVRKASLKGAEINAISPVKYDYHFDVKNHVVPAAGNMVYALAGVAKAVIELTHARVSEDTRHLLADITPSTDERAIAHSLKDQPTGTILFGPAALNASNASALRYLAGIIAESAGVQLGQLTEGANAAGIELAGAVPHRAVGGQVAKPVGLSAKEMIKDPLKAYILFGVEPEHDFIHAASAINAFQAADSVIAFTSYVTDTLKAVADVIMPIATFAETSGTYVNTEGRWQPFTGAIKPAGESRPGWKVLRVLGNWMEIAGFDQYDSSEEISQDIQEQIQSTEREPYQTAICPTTLGGPNIGLHRISEWPIYGVDPIVRRSYALQQTQDAIAAGAYMSTSTAQQNKCKAGQTIEMNQGTHKQQLTVFIDDRIPQNAVLTPIGSPSGAATSTTQEGAH